MIYKNILNDVRSNDPTKRCLLYGATVLSNTELLAVLLRTGTKDNNVFDLSKLLLDFSGGLSGLYDLGIKDLKSIKGIGDSKAAQIACLLELSKRISKEKAYNRLDFSNPDSIAEYYMEDLRHLDREHLVLVMLDSRCRLIKDKIMSIGTVNGSMLSTREIFIEALSCDALSIVLLHNHPSGNPKPSNQDILVTKNVFEAGEIIGIQLLDHIIIGDNSYTSLKELNYI